jgi:hypothetical protein
MLPAFVNHKGTNFNDDQDFIRAIWNAIPFNLQFVTDSANLATLEIAI